MSDNESSSNGTEDTATPQGLAAQIDRAVAELDAPDDLTLETLVDHVAQLRGRPIEIIESDRLTGVPVCGLWFALEERDVIYHGRTRGRLHRQQIILHELGHMLLGHNDSSSVLHYRNQTLFRHLSTETITQALARGAFHTNEELAAEGLADRLASVLRDAPGEILRYESVFE